MSYFGYRLVWPMAFLAMLGSACEEPFLKRVYHFEEQIEGMTALLDPTNRYLYLLSRSEIRVIDWREDRVVASKSVPSPCYVRGSPTTGYIHRFVFDRKAPQAYLEYCTDFYVLNVESLKLDIVKSFTARPEARYGVDYAHSPDGEWLLVARESQSQERHTTVTVLKAPELTPVNTFEMPNGYYSFVPGRNEIANKLRYPPGTPPPGVGGIRFLDSNCPIMLYEIPSGRELRTVTLELNGNDCPSGPVKFVPQREGILTGDNWHLIRFWDIQTGKLVKEISEERQITGGLAVSPDGKWLFAPVRSSWSIQTPRTFRIWDIESGSVVYESRLRPPRTSEVAFPSGRFSADGRYLAVAANDGVTLYEIMPGSAAQR